MKKLSLLLLTTVLVVAVGSTALAALKNMIATNDWDPTTSDIFEG